jgi:uncharacterized protein with HEPN domain
MKRPDDDVLLKDMADHARMAVTAAMGKARQDLDSDPVLAAALERFVEIIGEAASRLSDEARSRLPGVPWLEIIGMRNRLIHGYAAVDRNILWDVVASDLPALLSHLER